MTPQIEHSRHYGSLCACFKLLREAMLQWQARPGYAKSGIELAETAPEDELPSFQIFGREYKCSRTLKRSPEHQLAFEIRYVSGAEQVEQVYVFPHGKYQGKTANNQSFLYDVADLETFVSQLAVRLHMHAFGKLESL